MKCVVRPVVVGLALALLTSVGWGAEASAGPTVYRVELEKALEGGKALTLYLDGAGGTFTRGLGVGKGFNQMPHDVDVSGLKLEGHTIKGEVKVTVNADLWIPKGGKPVACTFALDATVGDGKITGTYKGKYGATEVGGAVAGGQEAALAKGAAATADLKLEDAIPDKKGSKVGKSRALVKLELKDGAVEKATVSMYNGSDGTVEKKDVTFDGQKLAGPLTVNVNGQSYVVSLNGQAIGSAVGGTFKTVQGDKEIKNGKFLGTLTPKDKP